MENRNKIRIREGIDFDQKLYRSFKEGNLFGVTGLFSQSYLYLPNFGSQADMQEGKGTLGSKKDSLRKDQEMGTPLGVSMAANSFNNLQAERGCFASCWCMDREIALQNTCKYDGAIIIVSRVNRLIESLCVSEANYSLELGKVEYVNNKASIPSKDGAVSIMMNDMAFIKKEEYAWEKETRFVAFKPLNGGLLSESLKEQPKSIHINVNIEILVDEIIICKQDISSEVMGNIEKISDQRHIKIASKGF